MIAKKRIAVTGSSGFVGSHLTRKLREVGYDVMEYDLKNGIDVTQWDVVSRLDAADILFHLAGPTFIPAAFDNPRMFLYTNTAGTINMMEYCKKHKTRMIYTSAYVYGIPQYLPIDEEHPVSGINPYLESKLMAEKVCTLYHRLYDVETFIIRPFNIFGPGQDKRFLIPTILEQFAHRKITLEDPEPKRDYLYIDDLIEAYTRLAQLKHSKYELLNIGSGKSYSVREIVLKIKELSNSSSEVAFSGRKRKNEIPETVASIARARRVLNWAPRVSLEEGILRLLKRSEPNH